MGDNRQSQLFLYIGWFNATSSGKQNVKITLLYKLHNAISYHSCMWLGPKLHKSIMNSIKIMLYGINMMK